MANRNKLRENYEDALFALLMDDLAQQEGERLIRENETLKEFSLPVFHFREMAFGERDV